MPQGCLVDLSSALGTVRIRDKDREDGNQALTDVLIRDFSHREVLNSCVSM